MTVVVGFAPNKDEYGGLELAALLARSSGQDVLAVTVVPALWPTPVAGTVDREFDEWAHSHGEAAVAEAQRVAVDHCLGVEFAATWVHGKSVAGSLLEEAQRREASMLVVGSGNDGRWGYVHVSSSADRLLHSAEVPVAIATRGFHADPTATVSRATCAFRGDDVSQRTLVAASQVCADIGASLRVATFAVRGRSMYPPDGGIGMSAEDMIMDRWISQANDAQAAALKTLDAAEDKPVEVTAVVASGRSWAAALGSLEWSHDEVLVVGSSSTGSLSRILLGSSARKIVRHSPVPVIVAP